MTISDERVIGTRRFTARDQEFFASLSFDRNPMHMDPIVARRLLTGKQVVHGIHVLITALEQWTNEEELRPVSVECTFNSAISVGDTVTFRQKTRGTRHVFIEACVDDLPCMKVRISTTAKVASAPAPPNKVNGGPIVRLTDAHDASPEHHLSIKNYAVEIAPLDVSPIFPRVTRYVGESGVSGIVALSYFVGMVCPGLNSIFATVNIKFDVDDPADRAIRLSVDRYDARFRLFHVSFAGGLAGSLTAFLRPPPQDQPPMADIMSRVAHDEFEGSRSLVIGASRGLGETVAKILAAGGSNIVLTYSQGREDSERVADEINSSRPGLGTARRLDIADLDSAEIAFGDFDAIYLFASPRIGRKKAAFYSPALLNEFTTSYSTALYELCRRIDSFALRSKVRVYVPSTVFIVDRPEGFVEYAMAKAAMEVLIVEINKVFKRVSVFSTRLPRLSTDQTSSVLNIATANTFDTLLPVVRMISGRNNAGD